MLAVFFLIIGAVWLFFIPQAWKALFRLIKARKTSYNLLWMPRELDWEKNSFEFLCVTTASSLICLLHTFIGLFLVYLGVVSLV